MPCGRSANEILTDEHERAKLDLKLSQQREEEYAAKAAAAKEAKGDRSQAEKDSEFLQCTIRYVSSFIEWYSEW